MAYPFHDLRGPGAGSCGSGGGGCIGPGGTGGFCVLGQYAPLPVADPIAMANYCIDYATAAPTIGGPTIACPPTSVPGEPG